MNMPLMSIVYTVYNQERYVRESLGSALAQDYENLEIVVSDDGSTDDTRKIIEEMVEEYRAGGGRHKVILNFNEQNLGVCGNFEFAFGLTHGELVFTFGGDDVSTPDRVRRIVEAWNESGRTAAVLASGGWLMDVDGNVYKDYGREVLNGAPVGAFAVYARKVFDDFPRIAAEVVRDTYEDSVYGLRAQFYAPPQYVDAQLVKYRYGSGISTGGGWRKRAARGARAVLASNRQLLADLDFVAGRFAADFVERKRKGLEWSVRHERDVLGLLAGESLAVRWRAYRRLMERKEYRRWLGLGLVVSC